MLFSIYADFLGNASLNTLLNNYSRDIIKAESKWRVEFLPQTSNSEIIGYVENTLEPYFLGRPARRTPLKIQKGADGTMKITEYNPLSSLQQASDCPDRLPYPYLSNYYTKKITNL
jgi:hypothetical protein